MQHAQRRTRIKVCCISSDAEAALAVRAGADAVGLVGAMPSGPGILTDETARAIALNVSPPTMPWLLTSEATGPAIRDHAAACAVSTVQIVRHVAPEVHDWLAAHAPALKRVQVIHVEGSEAPTLMQSYGKRPHAFLLDSGRPDAAELGGTGRKHDWTVSAQCVAAVEQPVFLAGGLSPTNAADAVRGVAPFGLDVCSGLRTNESLDEALLHEFVAAVALADRDQG
ncbi:MAG: phosphoribosylanthranilate isomerase [Pseudomonadota bacterium]